MMYVNNLPKPQYDQFSKKNAKNHNPVEQLTIYAMALSRKLNLPIRDFKAAWFDENSYFEFFPLHAVYRKEGTY